MILGVCEWISSKLGWNLTLIRVLFAVAAICYGAGVGLYLILWVVKKLSK